MFTDMSGRSNCWVRANGMVQRVKLANDVTYKRYVFLGHTDLYMCRTDSSSMNYTLKDLLKTPSEAYTTLQRVLLGLSSPTPPSVSSLKEFESISFTNDNLNASQKEAIRFALASPDIALIHGPPGTGKTATIVELILQFLSQGQRVLVCGPSNVSVDNIVERLAACAPATNMVRLGHPARLLPSVLEHSLEVLTRTSEAGVIVGDVRKEMDEKVASVRKAKNGRERKAIWNEVRDLRKEFREREGKCVEGLVDSAGVVCATLHGAGGRQVTHNKDRNKAFDVVVVDEAGQGLEAGCWVPIMAAGSQVRKVVLAGDHLQLPPTVKSGDGKEDKDEAKKRVKDLEEDLAKLAIKDDEVKAARKWSLEKTMFDRLLAMYGEDIKKLLNVQYRMHEKIMRFPSGELYDSKLVADKSVDSRLLSDLEYGVQDTDDTKEPLVFYDTQGGDFPEKTEEDGSGKKSVLLGDSKSNELEALVVKMHVQKLINAGVKDEDIAVITPYNAQLAVLQSLLKEAYPKLELGSVDGFQGREKEAVVVSLVRSNSDREVGFLGEKRRLNGKFSRQDKHGRILHYPHPQTLYTVESLRPCADICDSCNDPTEAPSLYRWRF